MKGGREKLYATTNLLVEDPTWSRLFIIPDSEWEFTATDVFGNADELISLSDGKARKHFVANTHGIISEWNYDETESRVGDYSKYLLETRWDKPELIRVRSEGRGEDRLEVLQTEIEGRRVDFVFGPEELLVREIRYFRPDGRLARAYSYQDYVDVSGIKMPQKEGFKLGGLRPDKDFKYTWIKFEINVDFDPRLFTRRPIVIKRDAWKRTNG